MINQINITDDRMGNNLQATVDFSRRQVTGPSEGHILAMIKRWPGHGHIYGTQTVQAPDPLGNKRDLAVFLAARFYPLPPDLEGLLPPAGKIPDGAVA